MNDPRYETLLKILDGIRNDAPDTEESKRFHSKKPDDLSFTRGQAFIHLFLWVKFGLSSFNERNSYICDGPVDGGLDAYYISETEKTVYLIQSKFRNTAKNFNAEAITVSELIRMEIERILHGHTSDSNGVLYNQKVLEFQLKLDKATRKQVYKQNVIFLANLKDVNDYQIRKLTSNLDYDVYDFERSYLELVEPMCSGTYYDPDKIVIELDLSEKSTPQLSQSITTSYGPCEVTAVYVPTKEIGRVMSQFKNALLRYNPRNYLGLSKNPVNKEIKRSIMESNHNDFALLNNGLTILAEEQEFTTLTGTRNVGRLTLARPQIINGGQTAYTLSEIYESEFSTNPPVFDGKEVLVRVVILRKRDDETPTERHVFIQKVSTSTNQQTHVKEADRFSSNPILVSIQKEIFRKYGYFLELKQGEFYNGRQKNYLSKEFIIDRILLLRAFIAFSGQPRPARANSETSIFESNFFNSIFPELSASDLSAMASKSFYAYLAHQFLVKLEKGEGKKSSKYGYALRYGKYAVVCASSIAMNGDFRANISSRSLQEIEQYITNKIPDILDQWRGFESKVQTFTENSNFFDATEQIADFANYYKGNTIASDLKSFFTTKTE